MTTINDPHAIDAAAASETTVRQPGDGVPAKRGLRRRVGLAIAAVGLVAAACGGATSAEPADPAEQTETGTEGSGDGHGAEASTEGGSEGSTGGGAEGGSEGSAEGGVEAAAGASTGTYFVSTGQSRGVVSTAALGPAQSYAGKLNDLELAIALDATSDRFVARVKNEAPSALCDTSIRLVVDGAPDTVAVLIPSLDVAERAEFSIGGLGPFDQWMVETETFDCTSQIAHVGEGSEGAAEGGGEGAEGAGHEGGGEGSEGGEGGGEGAESAEETSPSTPVSEPAAGTFNKLDFDVRYDAGANAFVGTVVNNTSAVVCASRLEVHAGAGGNVIELGPTIGVDLAPGQSSELYLEAGITVPETYNLHPESSACV